MVNEVCQIKNNNNQNYTRRSIVQFGQNQTAEGRDVIV